MIDVGDKITGLQIPQGFDGQCLVFIECLFDAVFVVALKNLVIGVTNNF